MSSCFIRRRGSSATKWRRLDRTRSRPSSRSNRSGWRCRAGGWLAAIPTLVLYGDFIEQDARWPTIRRNGVAFADAVNKAGGKVEVVDLPKIGIKGNSHMLMMDKNSSEIAA